MSVVGDAHFTLRDRIPTNLRRDGFNLDVLIEGDGSMMAFLLGSWRVVGFGRTFGGGN
jgi:hypothetical protein